MWHWGDSTSINVNSIYFYVANYTKMQDALLSLTYSEIFPLFITGKYMLSEQKSILFDVNFILFSFLTIF